jgi:hypothetical protein
MQNTKQLNRKKEKLILNSLKLIAILIKIRYPKIYFSKTIKTKEAPSKTVKVHLAKELTNNRKDTTK